MKRNVLCGIALVSVGLFGLFGLVNVFATQSQAQIGIPVYGPLVINKTYGTVDDKLYISLNNDCPETATGFSVISDGPSVSGELLSYKEFPPGTKRVTNYPLDRVWKDLGGNFIEGATTVKLICSENGNWLSQFTEPIHFSNGRYWDLCASGAVYDCDDNYLGKHPQPVNPAPPPYPTETPIIVTPYPEPPGFMDMRSVLPSPVVEPVIEEPIPDKVIEDSEVITITPEEEIPIAEPVLGVCSGT